MGAASSYRLFMTGSVRNRCIVGAVRAGRLVNLLLLLQTRGRMPAVELARKLEVSIRTVYRDVDALGEAGVPIYGERGPHGGIRLVEGYRTRLTGLTPEEAQALFLSGLPGPAAELGLANVVAAARLKVLAALPPDLGARAARLTERFHLDAPRWFQVREEVLHLEALARAVWEDQPVEIVYDRGDRAVTRRVEPLGLVLKAGTWYMVARCEGQERTYRVSRVLAATGLDGSFERPLDFDLAEFWSEAIAAYERDLPRLHVTVRVPEADLEAVVDAIGRRATDEAVRTARREPDGMLHLTLTFESLEEAAGPVLRMGRVAEVVDPPALRALVVETARSILERHGAADLEGGDPRGDPPRPVLDPVPEPAP